MVGHLLVSFSTIQHQWMRWFSAYIFICCAVVAVVLTPPPPHPHPHTHPLPRPHPFFSQHRPCSDSSQRFCYLARETNVKTSEKDKHKKAKREKWVEAAVWKTGVHIVLVVRDGFFC